MGRYGIIDLKMYGTWWEDGCEDMGNYTSECSDHMLTCLG